MSCGTELSARARFCHRCGAPASATGRPPRVPTVWGKEQMAWAVAAGVVIVLLGVIGWKMLAGTGGTRAPDMANAGNAGVASTQDPGGGLASGRAPDISQLSPQERFIRLNNRVMQAATTGDSATVINFTPMALGAYAQLDTVTQDDRYHAAILNAQVGRLTEALALADTMLQVTPGYLLAYAVRGEIADFERDSTALRQAWSGFLKAWPAESAASREEYVDHKAVIDAFRKQAETAVR
jgi:hypothetical protein